MQSLNVQKLMGLNVHLWEVEDQIQLLMVMKVHSKTRSQLEILQRANEQVLGLNNKRFKKRINQVLRHQPEPIPKMIKQPEPIPQMIKQMQLEQIPKLIIRPLKPPIKLLKQTKQHKLKMIQRVSRKKKNQKSKKWSMRNKKRTREYLAIPMNSREMIASLNGLREPRF